MITINPYIFYAIGVILLLIIIFFVTFLINRKIPVPKGCEHLKINEENCLGCTNTECTIKQGIDLEKIEKELESKDKEIK